MKSLTKQKISKLVTSNSLQYFQSVDKTSFDIGKKNKLVSRLLYSSHILSKANPRRSNNEVFFFLSFFPAYSVIAKISAHLHLSWLYLIYLTAKSINFLHEKLNPRKFSSLPTCGFLAQLVAAPSGYLGGMGSNPIQG